MSNNLKNFINDNRDDFDDRSPSVKVWQNVETTLSDKIIKRSSISPFFKWSMAVAALLVISTGVYFFSQKSKLSVTATETTEDKTEIPDAPEVNQFNRLINIKQLELKTLGKEQPELYSQFTKDIIQLDSSYTNLKNQLSSTLNRDMLLEAMIQNLQLQLNVLNQQLNIINEIKQSKKYSHEKSKQTI